MSERRTVRPVNGYACHHCGAVPDPDGDHSCPCPYTDSECPNHPAPSTTSAARQSELRLMRKAEFGPNTHTRGNCPCGRMHDYGDFL